MKTALNELESRDFPGSDGGLSEDAPEFCLETKGLSYRYAEHGSGLTDVHLQVPKGSIYGFLGPNGAGKTTTLRLVLGLLRKQHGSVELFGKEFSKHRISCLAKIGSLIESPSLYEHLTATENLRVMQKIHRVPAARIVDVLKLIGLSGTRTKLVGQFSLGMKQRLSIGLALLHEPSLLILDEPTNGLDPSGIIEMRELLKKLNRENGVTILISSHLLSEIEKLASHVGIIHRGRLLFQGTLEQLREKRQEAGIVTLGTSDDLRTLQFLSGQVPGARIENGCITMPCLSSARLARINRQLVEQGIDVHKLVAVESDLETIFMNMVSN
jgi:ABC-type multidrug transport system ATPase subunit